MRACECIFWEWRDYPERSLEVATLDRDCEIHGYLLDQEPDEDETE